MPRSLPVATLTVFALVAAFFLPAQVTQDWTQWGGPGRNFQVEARGLADTWPAGGPRVVWRHVLGLGHSSILHEAGRLYTMYRNGAREILVALNATNGKTIWEYGFDAPYPPRMQMRYGDGPHATPLISGNLICGTGTTARMHCVEKSTGKAAWSHDLWAEFQGSFIGVGYSSSPIAWRDLIIVQVGGPGASLVAFRRGDGSVAWRAHDFRSSSSSPILIRVGSGPSGGADQQEQLVAYMHNEIVGVNPADGALLWRHALRAAGSAWNFHFNVSTPVWGPTGTDDGLLFVSTAYGIGGRVLRLRRARGRTEVEELWQSERTRIHKETAIRRGDTIYASTGHLGPAFMTALDVRTGRVLWQDRGFSHANLLWTGERFIILDEDGTLALASPGANGMNVHAKHELFPSTSWTVPTLIGTRLYARNRTHIIALDLGK